MTEVEKEVKILFHAGLLIFIITVAVGMLNGLDLVEFDRHGLVTHVHAGTLGWILIAIATIRARVLPRWGAVLLIVAVLLGGAGAVAPVFWHISAAVFGVGVLWLGYAVWSGTGETTG